MALTMFSVVLLLVIASLCISGGRAVCPEPPTGVMAEAVGARGVRVTWLPFDISCITSIRAVFTPGGFSVLVTGGIGATEYSTASFLTCNTAYTVSVVAITAVKQVTSEGVSVIVGGPRDFSAATVSSTSVRLTWEPPASDCNVNITRYQVTYEYSKCGMTGEDSSQSLNPGELEYTFDGLEEDTEYVFTLTALGSGRTVTMTPISVTTLTAAPTGAPRSLANSAHQTSNSITITWNVVECTEQNGPITDYIVQYVTSCDVLQTNNIGNVSIYHISNLMANTEYIIQVAAVNQNGTGPFSEPAAGDPGDPIPAECPPPSSSSSLGISTSVAQTTITATSSVPMPTDGSPTSASRGGSNLSVGVAVSVAVVAVTARGPGDVMPTPTDGSPTSASGGGSSSSVGIAVSVAVVTVLLAVIIIVVIAILVLWMRQRKQPVRDKGVIPVELDAIVPTQADFDTSSEKENEQTTGVDNVNYEKVQSHPPVVKDYQEKVHTQEGQEVTLQVKVTGFPLPTITWFLGGRKVESDYSTEVRDDGSLTFAFVEPKHAGTYHFSASNSEGSVEGNTKLIVHADDDDAEEGGSAPKLESNPVQVEVFGEYVAGLHANSNAGFIVQYQTLPSGEDDQQVTIARTPENKNWNRFKNIVVYDGNRVVLKPIPGHRSLQHDYINASYIDGYSQTKRYIASQGPVPETTADLWRLVWQENIQAIFMVTNVVEGGHDKCEQYWPDSGSQQYGPFRVTLSEQQVFADYIIRTMQLESENGNPKKVIQYHFTSWPDHGVPEYAGPILVYYRRLKAKHRPSRRPILIHCSAGVGRTGTLICINIALEQAAREGVVDIAGIVSKIRKQRVKMVQTTDQYVFIHDAVLESLICGNTQIPASNLKGTITKLGQKDSESGRTGFETQFHVLHQVTPKPTEVVRATGLKFPNKNRDMNFLPPDKWRVLLKSEVPDYIHASFANGYKHSKGFIIAQAPMKSTCRDFWKMVYERECGVIVMLSDLTENGEELCHQYWPSPPGKAVQKYGEYAVSTQKEVEFEGFTQRIIHVTDPQSGQVQKVTQFQLSGWTPDGLCTNTRAIIDIIEQVGGVQRRTGNKPIVIHGSDTVSRSGVFCTLMNMIECCKTEGIVDVFQVVKALRIQKPGSVLTVEQYRFIFDMMLLFLDSFSIYSNFK